MVQSNHELRGTTMRVGWLVLGMVLLAVGGQGTIRLLVDHDDAGLLSGLPGGFAVRLVGYLVVVAVGLLLAARSSTAAGPS
jgi:hypothetical protein